MGRWNGVGGKIEAGETITESVKREIQEETAFTPADYELRFAGQMLWNDDEKALGGMYLFVAELNHAISHDSAAVTREGILAFKALDWILADSNTGIVDNVPYTLSHILTQTKPIDIQTTYKQNKLIAITHHSLQETNLYL